MASCWWRTRQKSSNGYKLIAASTHALQCCTFSGKPKGKKQPKYRTHAHTNQFQKRNLRWERIPLNSEIWHLQVPPIQLVNCNEVFFFFFSLFCPTRGFFLIFLSDELFLARIPEAQSHPPPAPRPTPSTHFKQYLLSIQYFPGIPIVRR